MHGTDLTTAPDPRVRLAHLPNVRHWILVSVIGVLLIVSIGFVAKLMPGFAPTELRVDQVLSAHEDTPLTWLAMGVAFLFSPALNVAILAASFVFLLLVRRSPVNAFAFTALATCGWLSSEVFKLAVAMPRPNGHLLAHPLMAETGHDSFPSGHTTFVASYAIACILLARQTRWAILTLVISLVAVAGVAASRIYVGAHYPTDVIGSVLVALTVAVCFTGLWNLFGIRVLRMIPLLDRVGPIPARPSRRHLTVGRAHSAGN